MQGLRAFQRYFDFSGRSGRAEYWQFVGIITASLLMALFIDAAAGNITNPVLTIIVGLALVIPGYALATRRMHDRGYSGWWVATCAGLAVFRLLVVYTAGQNAYTSVGDALGTFAKLLEYVLLGLNGFALFQAVKRGEPDSNRYGPAPGDADGPAPTIAQLIEKAKQVGATTSPSQPAPVRAVELDPLDQIKRLAELRDSGALTEIEFTERKAALLGRM